MATRQAESPHQLRVYWHFRDELSAQDNLIYKGERLVIPPAVRNRMTEEIHASHQGIQASIREHVTACIGLV